MSKNLVYDFTNQSSTSVNNSIGIILIGNRAVVHLQLGTILMEQNKDAILQNITKTRHLQEYTNTADGLCELTTQRWRNDSGVLHLAIVLTDGRSTPNYRAQNCDNGNTEDVATTLREKFPNILVFAIGIGSKIKEAELAAIASKSHLTSKLVAGFSQLSSMPNTLHYKICSTSKCMQ